MKSFRAANAEFKFKKTVPTTDKTVEHGISGFKTKLVRRQVRSNN